MPLLVLVTICVLLGSGIGLPPDLMGSAPREQDWSALGPEVRVVDGDTLRLGDRTVRLARIDAPERGQACADAAGRVFDCGAAAAEAGVEAGLGHRLLRPGRAGFRDEAGCAAATDGADPGERVAHESLTLPVRSCCIMP